MESFSSSQNTIQAPRTGFGVRLPLRTGFLSDGKPEGNLIRFKLEEDHSAGQMMRDWGKASHRKTNKEALATIQEMRRAGLKWVGGWRGGAQCERISGNKSHRSRTGYRE